MKKNLLTLFLIIALSSCNSYKKIVYVQNAGESVTYSDTVASTIPDPVLKAGDLLIITVNSNTPEAALPFNLPLVPMAESMEAYTIGRNSAGGSGSLQNYLIDVNGILTFPVIGKIHAAGMTKTELSDYISNKIHPFYIKDVPIITIRYANYKISVLGEVTRPNVYEIKNEKINIFEAIAMAGDLTIYGKRDNILLIREDESGKRQSIRIDLRDKRLVESPYYFLQQNDVLYVQPNNPKSRASGFSTAESITISVVGTLISLTSLLVNLLR